MIILAGAALRVYHLSDESVWMDEIVCVKHLQAPTLSNFIRLERADDPPMTPAYFGLAYLWGRMVGPSVTTMRLLSVLFSVLTMALLYRLARDMFGELGAAITLFCVAASPVHIYFAQEIRMYEFALLLVVVSMTGLRAALHSNSGAGWILFTVSTVALMWTHLFGTFVIAVQGIVLLVFLRARSYRLWTWLGVCAASFAGLLAWLATMDKTNLDRLAVWIPQVSAKACHDLVLYECGIPVGSWPQYLQFNHTSLAVVIVAGVIFLGWVLYRKQGKGSRLGRNEIARRDYVILVLWWLAPPVLLALVSILVRPTFVPRYVLYSSLALFILLGGAVAAIRPRILRGGATALIVLLYGSMAVCNTSALPMRGDWQKVTNAILATNHPKDPICYVGASLLTPSAIGYYLSPYRYEAREFSRVEDLWAAVLDRTKQGNGAWVVFGENKEDQAQEQRFTELLGAHPADHTLKSFPSARGAIRTYYFSGD